MTFEEQYLDNYYDLVVDSHLILEKYPNYIVIDDHTGLQLVGASLEPIVWQAMKKHNLTMQEGHRDELNIILKEMIENGKYGKV